MKIGVVRYPGTNCFYDTIRYFGEENCIELLWDKYDERDHLDLVIIPYIFVLMFMFFICEKYSKYKMTLSSESWIRNYL